jgi:hypothetical protein
MMMMKSDQSRLSVAVNQLHAIREARTRWQRHEEACAGATASTPTPTKASTTLPPPRETTHPRARTLDAPL